MSKHLIIGGTIKAATSSIFTYLSAHPEICGSYIKETFFFTHKYTGDSDVDQREYEKYFNFSEPCSIAVEASPNYLGYKENVAPRIKKLIPDAKLIFILRNPVERLYSYYNFSVAKLELPKDLGFDNYIKLCEGYSLNDAVTNKARITEKHLRALELGKYSESLKNYYDVFDASQIKVVFYDDIKSDIVQFMADLCHFVNVDPNFYQDYTFNKVNVTFSGRVKILHFIALMLNRILESVLRQRPGLKMFLVRMYKKLNQSQEGYTEMTDSIRKKLLEYYSKSNSDLAKQLPGQKLPAWIK